MKTTASSWIAISLLAIGLTHSVRGAGVVTNTTETNLRAALYNGGIATFSVSGTVTLASPILITNNTLVDATGQIVVVDGNNSVRIFEVATNIQLTLKNLVISHGRYQSPDSSIPSGTGSNGVSGAIMINGGSVRLIDCEIVTNIVVGGRGAPGTFGPGGFGLTGSGGAGFGGAIFLNGGKLEAIRTRFIGNLAIGGDGAVTGLRDKYQGTGGLAGGGAIFNNGGALILTDCTFTVNTAQGGKAPAWLEGWGDISGGAVGGALATSNGLTTISGCTFENNTAITATIDRSVNFGGEALGGAGFFFGGATIINSTLTDNSAMAGRRRDSYGGGVFVSDGMLSLINVTLANNGASSEEAFGGTGQGGNVATTNGALRLVNSIVAHSLSGSNCFGTITDAGHNLSSDDSASFTALGSLNNSDPKLGVLADNGGPTWTMALLPSSPALDTADSSAAPATDQRGLLRPFGFGSDIGAYEWGTPFVIQGRVTGFTLTNEISLSIGSTTMTTTNGWFGLVGVPAGTHVITPSDANYVFVPASRTVTIGPDQPAADFVAYRRNTLSIGGLAYGMVDLAYAGTNAQVVRVLVSTNGNVWSPYSTNSIGSNNVLNVTSPMNGPLRLFRTERIQ